MEARALLSAALHGWFGRSPPAPGAALETDGAPSLTGSVHDDAPPVSDQPRSPWSADRLAVTDRLWGDGSIGPGGEMEILRLIRPIGLSPAADLLLVGVGGGGAASSIVRNTGAWVAGVEAEPVLLKRAQALMKAGRFGKRVSSRGGILSIRNLPAGATIIAWRWSRCRAALGRSLFWMGFR